MDFGNNKIATNQMFGEVTYTTGRAFQWGKYDGIVGLAFPKLAIDGATPPFDTLFYQKQVCCGFQALIGFIQFFFVILLFANSP
jgi:hypothetical protein